jgi:hypothetical protein
VLSSACWKARHDANQYSRIYGQHEVQFTQSLTQQQRDDVECFKAVVTLATQLGRRAELIHFPVVMLRVNGSYASTPEEAAIMLLADSGS